MTRGLRRVALGLGAALLVGGWGLTRYAETQQQTDQAGAPRRRIWVGTFDAKVPASRSYYAGGIAGMAIGAGLLGLGWLREEVKP